MIDLPIYRRIFNKKDDDDNSKHIIWVIIGTAAIGVLLAIIVRLIS